MKIMKTRDELLVAAGRSTGHAKPGAQIETVVREPSGREIAADRIRPAAENEANRRRTELSRKISDHSHKTRYKTYFLLN
jgi:hypothetical protein